MTRLQQQKGFTLVELAIVITIIGLLIGGILKGQQLMTNARVTSTIQQVKAVEAASTTFYDSYGALPGDMDGTNKIPNCNAACGFASPVTLHNGVIGDPAWDLKTPQGSAGILPAAGVEASEPGLFWFYLAATGMLSSMDGSAPNTSVAVFGQTAPATKFGGGFLVGNDNGAVMGARVAGSMNPSITGTILSMVVSPTATPVPGTAGSFLLVPAVAAQMDRKMDDGNPAGGDVQAFGADGCTVPTGGIVAGATYNEGNTSKDCGLYIHISG
jgi:prepilin-type N-terminal cleavage/methylation domain-containing protein